LGTVADIQVAIQLDAEQYLQELTKISEQTEKLGKQLALEIPIEFNSSGIEGVTKEVAAADAGTQKLISSFGQLSKELQGQAKTLEEQNKTAAAKISSLQQEQRLVSSSSQSYARISTEIAKLQSANNSRIRDLQGINKKIKEANDLYAKQKAAVAELARGVDFNALGNAFDSLIGKLTVGGILVEAFKAATQGLFDVLRQGIAFQQLTLGLEAFTGGVQNAEAAYADFKDTALKTPFSVEGVAQAGKVMLAFGLTTEETAVATRQLAVVAGATGGDLNNLARNLGQISAQGRAYTRDLNQFAIAGIPIYQELAKELGVSVVAVREFAEQGSIGFSEVSRALANLTEDGSAFAKLADKQLDTIAGQIGNVGTAVFELGGRFVESTSGIAVPALKLLGATIELVANNLTLLSGILVTKTVLSIAKLVQSLGTSTGPLNLLVKGLDLITANSADFTKKVEEMAKALAAKGVALDATSLKLKAYLAVLGPALAKFALFAAAAIAVTAAIQTLNQILGGGNKFKQFKEDIDSATLELKGLKQAAEEVPDNLGIIDTFKNFSATSGPFVGAIDTIKSSVQKLIPEALVPLARAIDPLGFSFASVTAAEAELNNGTIALNDSLQKQALLTGEVLSGINAARQGKTQDLAEVNRLSAGLGALNKANQNLIATVPAQIQALKQQQAALGASTTGGRAAQLQINTLTAALQAAKAEEKAFTVLDAELKQLALTAANTAIALGKVTEDVANVKLAALKEEFETFKRFSEIEIQAIQAAGAERVRTIEDAKAQEESAHSRRVQQLDDQLGRLRDQRDAVRDRIDAEIADLEKRGPAEQALYDLQKRRLELRARDGSLSEEERVRAQADLERLNKREQIEVLRLEKKEAEKKIDTEIAQIEAQKASQAKAYNERIDQLNTQLADSKKNTESQVAALQSGLEAAQKAITAASDQATKLSEGATAAGDGATNQANWRDRIREATREALELERALRNAATAGRGGGGPNEFAGGPVAGGKTYTVNELGKEAFLSASGRLSMINSPAWGQWTAPSSGTIIPAHLTKQLDIPSSGINLRNIRQPSATSRASAGSDMPLVQSLNRISSVQHEQATELGRLSRTLDRIEQREWKVDVNIAGNNPLLNKLRKR
jgi:tape measure domain-containing protein